MVPWSIKRVADLPPNAKWRKKMQQYMDGLVQLIGAATPNVPHQAPMPQASKQLLIVCGVSPMYIIVTVLVGCQSCILRSNEWLLNPCRLGAHMWVDRLHHPCLLGGPPWGQNRTCLPNPCVPEVPN